MNIIVISNLDFIAYMRLEMRFMERAENAVVHCHSRTMRFLHGLFQVGADYGTELRVEPPLSSSSMISAVNYSFHSIIKQAQL